MNLTKCRSINGCSIIIVLLLTLQPIGLLGCGRINWPRIDWQGGHSRISREFKVMPTSNREVANLSADDIVLIMRQAGFSTEQIFELGTAVRDGLLHSGAVQIKRKKFVEAIFAVNGDYIFISTRLRGMFIYDFKKGIFGPNSASSG